MQLEENDVHLWLTDLKTVDRIRADDYLALMSDDERERNSRYRFADSRFTDAVTRALARTVLSRYVDLPPTAWRFSRGEHGKPEIDVPGLARPLRFNLSHSKGFVVCAVTPGRDVGVDVEWTERANALEEIAGRFFSAAEVTAFSALAEGQKKRRFFDYWTLKEAYMKASGEGISLGLGNFSFQLPDDGPIAIAFGDTLRDDPAQWQFWLGDVAADHRLAVALRAPVDAETRLRLFDTVPLEEGVVERKGFCASPLSGFA